jgi:hypothetical protein
VPCRAGNPGTRRQGRRRCHRRLRRTRVFRTCSPWCRSPSAGRRPPPWEICVFIAEKNEQILAGIQPRSCCSTQRSSRFTCKQVECWNRNPRASRSSRTSSGVCPPSRRLPSTRPNKRRSAGKAKRPPHNSQRLLL